jgi:hypothetical protein
VLIIQFVLSLHNLQTLRKIVVLVVTVRAPETAPAVSYIALDWSKGQLSLNSSLAALIVT